MNIHELTKDLVKIKDMCAEISALQNENNDIHITLNRLKCDIDRVDSMLNHIITVLYDKKIL